MLADQTKEVIIWSQGDREQRSATSVVFIRFRKKSQGVGMLLKVDLGDLGKTSGALRICAQGQEKTKKYR